ncbi:hypothetical protein AABB24_012484 [Solanum stoloniferum]|uniref:Uncharacterized protein n=1 Tax=Solanum stoloniferum TaxID=62892 RepID=A0ABD2U489_9SOLN
MIPGDQQSPSTKNSNSQHRTGLANSSSQPATRRTGARASTTGSSTKRCSVQQTSKPAQAATSSRRRHLATTSSSDRPFFLGSESIKDGSTKIRPGSFFSA